MRGFKCDIAEDSVTQIQIQEIRPNTYISLIIVIEDRRNVTVVVGFKCDIAESIIPHSDDRQTQTHTNELACDRFFPKKIHKYIVILDHFWQKHKHKTHTSVCQPGLSYQLS